MTGLTTKVQRTGRHATLQLAGMRQTSAGKTDEIEQPEQETKKGARHIGAVRNQIAPSPSNLADHFRCDELQTTLLGGKMGVRSRA